MFFFFVVLAMPQMSDAKHPAIWSHPAYISVSLMSCHVKLKTDFNHRKRESIFLTHFSWSTSILGNPSDKKYIDPFLPLIKDHFPWQTNGTSFSEASWGFHESTLPFPGNLIHIPAAAPGAAWGESMDAGVWPRRCTEFNLRFFKF